jgi:hypothetical protein
MNVGLEKNAVGTVEFETRLNLCHQGIAGLLADTYFVTV